MEGRPTRCVSPCNVRNWSLTCAFISGRCGARTHDLLLVRQALYQLS